MEEINNDKTENSLAGAVEAVLFVYGEPMDAKKIAKVLESDPKSRTHPNALKKNEEAVKKAIEELSKKYSEGKGGLTLIISDDKAQLSTKPEFSALLENFIKDEFKEQLTPASIETLSLIAYLGPLSRAQIDYYRGVNSSFILRALMIRGLIERFSDSEKSQEYLYNGQKARYIKGIPYYKPSMDLLKYLGISKIEELPEYEKFKSITQNIQL